MHERYTDETAYTIDNLEQLLNSNDAVPDWFCNRDILQRVVTTATSRAVSRGDESALEETDVECLIVTDWHSWNKNNFGFDDGSVNQVALGVINVRATAGNDAILFNDSVILQTGWLRSGDGRRKQAATYVDDDFDQSEDGELWIPRGAAKYMSIIALSDELLHGDPTIAEAM